MSSPFIDAIIANKPSNEVWMSLEFFPPKTEKGVENLYHMIDHKLANLKPVFADFTWGAGGSTSDLTLDLCIQVKKRNGLNPNMHLTCTNMEKQKVLDALAGCEAAGITNILALRGDPPAGQEQWAAVEGGFTCALDLVRFIKENYGSKFCIGVAGYPEGHPSNMTHVDSLGDLSPSELGRARKALTESGELEITVSRDAAYAEELAYLKQKVDAGASYIITQLFFDTDVFLAFVRDCRAIGITVPIVPGIMCIASAGGFKRMTKFCKTRVPESLLQEIEAVSNDEAAKEVGVRYGTEMCQRLLQAGIDGLHFYTLNMSHVTVDIVHNLKESGVKFYEPIVDGNGQVHPTLEALALASATATSATVFDEHIASLSSASASAS